tara:strand:+ start:102 stop:446 length:345 start_codon:yes stop_codon:yes gene_type:complete
MTRRRILSAIVSIFGICLVQPIPANEKQESLSADDRIKIKEAAVHLERLSVHRKSLFTRLLNQGTAVQIAALPGVGKMTAQRIIEGRPYQTSAHVVLVKGVGEKTFARMAKSMR